MYFLKCNLGYGLAVSIFLHMVFCLFSHARNYPSKLMMTADSGSESGESNRSLTGLAMMSNKFSVLMRAGLVEDSCAKLSFPMTGWQLIAATCCVPFIIVFNCIRDVTDIGPSGGQGGNRPAPNYFLNKGNDSKVKQKTNVFTLNLSVKYFKIM